MALTAEHISFAFDRLARCGDPAFQMAPDERAEMIEVCRLLHADSRQAPVMMVRVDGPGRLSIRAGTRELKPDEPFGWFVMDYATGNLMKVVLTTSGTPKGIPTPEELDAVACDQYSIP